MKNNTYQAESCNCLSTCHSVQYNYVEKQLPINPEEECGNAGQGFQYSNKKYKNVQMYKLAQNQMKMNIEGGRPFNIQTQFDYGKLIRGFCHDSFRKDIAIVEIQIEGQSFVRMRQSLRKTLGDKLGELGGMLGLFTGFSFMAIVELIYWILVTLQRIFKDAIPDPNRFRRT